MEQQTATANNPLPGAKKSLPYITETSESIPKYSDNFSYAYASYYILEARWIKQGQFVFNFPPPFLKSK